MLLVCSCALIGCDTDDTDDASSANNTSPANTTNTGSPNAATSNTTVSAEAMEAFIDSAHDAHGFIGVGLGVQDYAAGDSGRWTGARGLASVETERAMSAADTLQVGSLHKTLTAVVIFQLIEEGALALETPLSRWTDAVPDAARITVGQLLAHTSGLADYTASPDVLSDPSRPWSREELVEVTVGMGAHFEPGQGWSYSNTGYVLLGQIIEAETGTTWAEAQRVRVLEPAGMTASFFRGFEDGQETCVGYMQLDEGLMPTTGYIHPSLPGPAGSLVSNTADLLALLDALFRGALVSPAQLEAMTTPRALAHTTDDGREVHSGMGLYVSELEGTTVFSHDGGIPGFTAFMAYAPERELGVAVAVNSEPGEAQAIGEAWLREALRP